LIPINNILVFKRLIVFFTILACFIISIKSFANQSDAPRQEKSDGFQLYNDARKSISVGDYDTSIYLLNQAKYYFENDDFPKEYISCLVQIANIYLDQGLFDSAFYYVNISLQYSKEHQIDDGKTFGESFFVLGKLFNRTGMIDSAEFYLNKARIYGESSKNDSILPLIIKSIGNIYYVKGEYQNALDHYRSSLSIELKRHNSSQKLLASLYQNTGIGYSMLGNHDSAKFYFQRSLNLKEKLLPNDDPQLARGYLNYGRFLQTMGDQYEALEYQDKAENIYLLKYGNEYFGLSSIYFNKGSIYIMLNDYDKSLIYHERALELYKKQYDSDHYIFSRIYNNLGLINRYLGKLDIAIEYFNKCLEKESDIGSLLRVYRNIGECYYELEELTKAEEYYLLAVEISKDNFGKDNTHIADSYLNYGTFCISQMQYDKAEIYLNKALGIFTENFGNKNRHVSNALNQLGKYYQNIHEYEYAINTYQKALVSFVEDFNNLDIYTNPELQIIEPDLNIISTLKGKSLALYQQYKYNIGSENDLVASLQTSQLAIQLVELIRSTFGEENSKLLVMEEVNEIYDLAVVVASDLYAKTRERKYLNLAFESSERGKAAVLLSSVRELEAIELVSIPIEIRETEKKLNTEILLYKKLVYDETQKSGPDSSKINTWKRQIFEKTKSHDSLISSIENSYPDYYNLKYNFEVIGVSDIQGILTKNEAFIEYNVSDSILTTFLISTDTAIIHNEIIGIDFSQRISDIVGSINKVSDDFGSKDEYLSYSLESYNLYKKMIEPLGLSEDIENLIIIPDGVLGYLNFETLIKTNPDTTKVNYRSLDYLIRSYTMSYGYSGTVLFHRYESTSRTKELMAMAPEYNFNESEVANNSISVRNMTKNLNSLDHIIEEVTRVNEIYKGQLLIGEEATEANFKSNAHKYNILHFAMHTLVNDENPLNSKLVFTLNNDTVEDGFLNTYEIYNLDLNAELAVLSACKTGVGKLSKGEGIMSLARGFLYAGVPGIVMTLWEVEDIASANVITGFYENLKEGLNKDVALRESKLTYLETADQFQSHPYFWAAYVQIGNNNPVITYSNKMYFVYAAIVFGVVGLLFFVRKKRILKKNS